MGAREQQLQALILLTFRFNFDPVLPETLSKCDQGMQKNLYKPQAYKALHPIVPTAESATSPLGLQSVRLEQRKEAPN